MRGYRKKVAKDINKTAREVFDYVGGIGRDRYENPSSKRWMALGSFVTLIFVVVYILLNHKEYDAYIVLILVSSLVLLILVLMGYSSLAEKIVQTVSGKKEEGVKKESEEIENI